MESNLAIPAVVISTSADCADVWGGVLLGIEEKGIPFVTQENSSTDAIHNVWSAACQSPSLVGIGCNREKPVIYCKNPPTSAPFFTLTYQQNSHNRRSIGNNAVWLVKGTSFRKCHSQPTGEKQHE